MSQELLLTRICNRCRNVGEDEIFDQQVARCSRVWGKREVAYNALDSNRKVLTVRIIFVVCEVRRPLLSLAMLEDKGFHMTVKNGCRILGGHGQEMCLRRQGIRVMWMWNSKADCLKRRGRVDFLLDSWLLWPVVWQVFLSLHLWMERRTVTVSTPETPNRETVKITSVDSHSLRSMVPSLCCWQRP